MIAAEGIARVIVGAALVVLTPLMLRALGRRFAGVAATGVVAAGALALEPGWVAAMLVAPYVLACARHAAGAIARIAARGLRPASELVAELSLVYLAGASVWLIAFAAGHRLLGYPRLWVLLTAAHFHVAGGYLCAIAALHARRGGAWRAAAALAVALGVPLTAAGIHGPRWLETSAALATAAGGVAVAISALDGARRAGDGARRAGDGARRAGDGARPATDGSPGPGLARALHATSALALLAGMALAATYALRAHVGAFTIGGLDPLSSMAVTHGVFDAAGFALPALLAFALAPPPAAAPFAPPFTRVAGGWRIGPRFFADRGLERAPASSPRGGERAPRGLVDDLDELGWHDADTAAIAPEIRAFYERTGQHALVVRPRWRRGFRLGARLWARLGRRLGQLQLPVDAERGDEGIRSRIVALDATADGRPAPRAWIRTFADGRAMYVAAYATHVTAGIPYMNIAFPLPGGHLASILRLDRLPGDGGALVLSTRTGGDAGIYLVARGFGRCWPLRLPLSETVRVWTTRDPDAPADLRAAAPAGATTIARHDLWLAGLHYLTLDYAMTDQATSTS